MSHLNLEDDAVVKLHDPKSAEPPRIVKLIRDRCQFRSIANMYRSMNDDPDGEISREELSIGFDKLGFTLKPSEFRELWDFVDTDRSGGISMQELLVAFTIEGSMGGVGAGTGHGGAGDLIQNSEYDQMVAMINSTSLNLPEEAKPAKKEVSARQLVEFLRDRGEARDSFRNFFKDMDVDNTGSLDKQEVGVLLDRMNLTIKPEEMDRVFAFCDTDDQDGEINFSEFTSTVMQAQEVELDRKLGRKRMASISFDSIEEDGTGKREGKHVAQLRRELGYSNSIVTSLAKADTNSDGIITREEFVKYIVQQQAIHPETHKEEYAKALWDSADKANRGSVDLRRLVSALQAGLPGLVSTQDTVRNFALSRQESARPHSAGRSTRASFYSAPEIDPTITHKECAFLPERASPMMRGRFARTPYRDTSHMVESEETPTIAWRAEDHESAQESDMRKNQRKHDQREHRHEHNTKRISAYVTKKREHVRAYEEGRVTGKVVQKMRYLKALSEQEGLSERMRGKLDAQLQRVKDLAASGRDLSLGPHPNFGKVSTTIAC